MAGHPQVRESAWLYAPDNPYIPLAHVRLEERMDGSGWDVYLSDPASAPSQHVRWPDREGVRAELERIYSDGRARGEWRVHHHDNY